MMSKSFQIKILERGSGVETSVSGAIPDEEWDKMTVFTDEVVRLESTRAVSQGLRVQIQFKGDSTSNKLQFAGSLPHNDDIVVIMHRLRPFILQKEPANFNRVTNILSQYLENAKAREVINGMKDEFSGKNFQQQLRINWKSAEMRAVVNSEDTLMKWLNSCEYHRDDDKRHEIDELRKILPDPALHALFVSMLFDKVHSIQNVAILIRAVDQSNGAPLTIP